MVCGAARELVVGAPSDLATDVGPVNDAEAFDGIRRSTWPAYKRRQRTCWVSRARPRKLARILTRKITT